MKDLINFKFFILILLLHKIDCEIIPIHIGNPNHRHFVRTTPHKNENNLRSVGLIPISKNQIDLNNQMSLIQPTNDQMNENFNFEYNKRIGLPAKRSAYMQTTRSLIDHSNGAPVVLSTEANNNFYEREKQKIFKREEMANYQPNSYLQSNYQHTPQNYGYIPSSPNQNAYQPNAYQQNNHYDYTRNQPYKPVNQAYNQAYNQPINQPINQPVNQAYNQPIEPHQQYNQNSPDYHQQNELLEKEFNDINLDGSFYDMPFDQSIDNGQNQMNFNDPMNLDSYFV